MALTATSSLSSFKRALVSLCIFLGVLTCCNSQYKSTTHKDLKISCKSFYVKDTLGVITCELEYSMFAYMCKPPPYLLQFVISNDLQSKCDVKNIFQIQECRGKAPRDKVVDCEGDFDRAKFNCNFMATEIFEGKKAHCVIPCKDPNPTPVYNRIITNSCDLIFGTPPPPTAEPPLPPPLAPAPTPALPPTPEPPPISAPPSTSAPPSPEQEKTFPTLMAILIACAIAGFIGLVGLMLWKKRRQAQSDAETNPESERTENPERTQQTTETSEWTEQTTETSVSELEAETTV